MAENTGLAKEITKTGRQNFFAIQREGMDMFTLRDLEAIVGVAIFDDDTDKSQALHDDVFYSALVRLQQDGVIAKALRDV